MKLNLLFIIMDLLIYSPIRSYLRTANYASFQNQRKVSLWRIYELVVQSQQADSHSANYEHEKGNDAYSKD